MKWIGSKDTEVTILRDINAENRLQTVLQCCSNDLSPATVAVSYNSVGTGSWYCIAENFYYEVTFIFIAASDFSIASLSQSSLNLDGSVNQSCLSLPNSSVSAMTTGGVSMATSLTAPTVESMASSLLTNVQYSQALPIPLGEATYVCSLGLKKKT